MTPVMTPLAAGPGVKLHSSRFNTLSTSMHRNPLYHDVSPSKPIEFEDLEEPTPLSLLKAIETIDELIFSPGPAAAADDPTQVKRPFEKKGQTSTTPDGLAPNSLAAAVAAAKQRREEREELGREVSIHDRIERMPSDRQTYRSADKQSHEWTQIMPHFWARGRSHQPPPSKSALELEGVQAVIIPRPTSTSHSSPQLPLYSLSSIDNDIEIRGIQIHGPPEASQDDEEVFAAHGSFSEHFALHDSTMNQHISSHHASGLYGKKGRKNQRTTLIGKILGASKGLDTQAKHSTALARPGVLERDERAEKVGLPPMEPSRNLICQAVDILMDRLWSKILPSLLPLVMKRIEARRRATAAESPYGYGRVSRVSRRPSGVPSSLGVLPESESVHQFERLSLGGQGRHSRNKSSSSQHPHFSPSPRTSVGGTGSSSPANTFKRRSWYDGIGGSIDATPPSPLSEAPNSETPSTLPKDREFITSSSGSALRGAGSPPPWSPIRLPQRAMGNSHSMQVRLQTIPASTPQRSRGTPLSPPLAPLQPIPHAVKSPVQPIPTHALSHVNQLSSGSMFWQSASTLSRRSLPAINAPKSHVPELEAPKAMQTFPFPSSKR